MGLGVHLEGRSEAGPADPRLTPALHPHQPSSDAQNNHTAARQSRRPTTGGTVSSAAPSIYAQLPPMMVGIDKVAAAKTKRRTHHEEEGTGGRNSGRGHGTSSLKGKGARGSRGPSGSLAAESQALDAAMASLLGTSGITTKPKSKSRPGPRPRAGREGFQQQRPHGQGPDQGAAAGNSARGSSVPSSSTGQSSALAPEDLHALLRHAVGASGADHSNLHFLDSSEDIEEPVTGEGGGTGIAKLRKRALAAHDVPSPSLADAATVTIGDYMVLIGGASPPKDPWALNLEMQALDQHQHQQQQEQDHEHPHTHTHTHTGLRGPGSGSFLMFNARLNRWHRLDPQVLPTPDAWPTEEELLADDQFKPLRRLGPTAAVLNGD